MTDELKKNPDWTKQKIKHDLDVAQTSLRKISISMNWNPGTLKIVLTRRYPAAQEAVAKALNTSPMIIWPSRYNEDGTPKKSKPGRKARTNSNIKKGLGK